MSPLYARLPVSMELLASEVSVDYYICLIRTPIAKVDRYVKSNLDDCFNVKNVNLSSGYVI